MMISVLCKFQNLEGKSVIKDNFGDFVSSHEKDIEVFNGFP